MANSLDAEGEPTRIFYTPGLKPDENLKSAPIPVLPGQSGGIRVYKAPADKSDVAEHKKRVGTWKAPRPPKRPEPPKEMEVPAEKKPVAEDETKKKDRLTSPFPLMFRPCEATDYNFVLNAWLRSYRDFERSIKSEAYYPGQQNLISELSQRRTMVIGCDADTPEWIAGFICGVPLEDGRMVIDYVYVKHAYRARGIARGLLKSLGHFTGQEIIATHKTRGAEGCFIRYNASYNPYFNKIGFSDV